MITAPTTITLNELFDFDSDFHVERAAIEAQNWAKMAAVAVKNGKEVLAGCAAKRAATAGREAMAILERRGSDDLEFFC